MSSEQQSEGWKEAFRLARDVVQRGDFDETKTALEGLGFAFKQTTDANHWLYYHPALRNDPHFRYPRNLYRPHGSRRSADQISRHDRSQAKQMIEALQSAQALLQPGGGSTNEIRD